MRTSTAISGPRRFNRRDAGLAAVFSSSPTGHHTQHLHLKGKAASRPARLVWVALAAAALATLPLAGALPAAAAAPITVCPAGCDHATIQTAIIAAASGATIVIEAGTYDGPLTIGTSLSRLGAGAAQTTIPVPPGGGTVITVDTGVSATVKGVTVSGGSSSYGGGIVNESGAALTLKEVTVSHNSAQIRGGGIYNGAGATLTADDSTLSGNTAALGGGAMINPGGTVALNGTTVTGNRSLAGRGGGIGNNGTMSLSDSTVTGNTTGSDGGGLFNNADGTLTVSDSTVSGNTAAGHGGGLFNFGPSATLTGSTVTGNTAGADGGGIYLDSGTVTLQDSTVGGNVPDNCAPPGAVAGCTG